MSDFDLERYVFSTVWTGFEQNASVYCDRCEPALWEDTGDSKGDSIDLAYFTALAMAHEKEVHGG